MSNVKSKHERGRCLRREVIDIAPYIVSGFSVHALVSVSVSPRGASGTPHGQPGPAAAAPPLPLCVNSNKNLKKLKTQ